LRRNTRPVVSSRSTHSPPIHSMRSGPQMMRKLGPPKRFLPALLSCSTQEISGCTESLRFNWLFVGCFLGQYGIGARLPQKLSGVIMRPSLALEMGESCFMALNRFGTELGAFGHCGPTILNILFAYSGHIMFLSMT